jgi:predicted phosphodiesterase
LKIFATSDIHGNFKALSRLTEFINNNRSIDVVLFCGDIVKDYVCGSVLELAELQYHGYRYFKYMLEQIKSNRVYFIRGDHDIFVPDKDDINFLPNLFKVGLESEFIPFEMICIDFYKSNSEGTERELKHH